jgi:hypothetical protein
VSERILNELPIEEETTFTGVQVMVSRDAAASGVIVLRNVHPVRNTARKNGC